MKAIGILTSLPIEEKNSFQLFELEKPQPAGRDLLVKIKAVAVNPIDYKIRQTIAKNITLEQPKILGWDAVGVVEAVGDQVSLFEAGDEVFYAGVMDRQGSNAAYQLVDERIVGKKPKSLSVEAAAAMPLTALTAYESIFHRMKINKNEGQQKSILIIGGAGGMGSIAIQLLKKLTPLQVIATASRDETKQWCLDMGADMIVDHRDLVASVRSQGIAHVDYIYNCNNSTLHWESMAALITPQGHINSIVSFEKPVDLNLLKNKSATFSWEFMYTRPIFETPDMIEQHHALNEISELLDSGILKSTLNKLLIGLSVENLKAAHALQESGKAIGKTVIKF